MRHSGQLARPYSGDSPFLYQPRVSLSQAQICGARVIGSPDTPETYRTLLRDIALINRASLPLSISVSLPAMKLMDSAIAHQLLLTVKSGQMRKRQLEVLLRDSHLAPDQSAFSARLQRLEEAGIKILLEDFGSAYASLDTLTTLPFSGVSISQAITSLHQTQGKGMLVLQSTVHMARSMGLDVIACGVQDTHGFGSLARLGCQKLEGDWISPPLTLTDFLTFAQSDKRWGGMEHAA